MCRDLIEPGERKLQQSALPGPSTESKSEVDTALFKSLLISWSYFLPLPKSKAEAMAGVAKLD